MSLDKYPIFEQWYKTTNSLLNCCEKFPKDVRFTVANRISGFALDNVELLAEAIYSRERREILQKVNLNLEKLRLLLRLSSERRYLSLKQYEDLSRAINETGKMLGGWQKSTQ